MSEVHVGVHLDYRLRVVVTAVSSSIEYLVTKNFVGRDQRVLTQGVREHVARYRDGASLVLLHHKERVRVVEQGVDAPVFVRQVFERGVESVE